MQYLPNTLSNDLTLEEVIARLSQSNFVDGLALFGSQASHPAGDYDLLILVMDPPVSIFQMLTHINGRIADVIFVEVAIADQFLQQPKPVPMASFEGMFLQKMLSARIVYDVSGRLGRTQQIVKANAFLLPSSETDLYSTWFWLNLGLFHLKRMIQMEDAVYHTSVDLMLMGALSSIARDYYRIRSLAWQGEKAAIRYLQSADPSYLEQLRTCIAEMDRHRKLDLYGQLVVQTIEPIGQVWAEGITALYLRDTPQIAPSLNEALKFWQNLFLD